MGASAFLSCGGIVAMLMAGYTIWREQTPNGMVLINFGFITLGTLASAVLAYRNRLNQSVLVLMLCLCGAMLIGALAVGYGVKAAAFPLLGSLILMSIFVSGRAAARKLTAGGVCLVIALWLLESYGLITGATADFQPNYGVVLASNIAGLVSCYLLCRAFIERSDLTLAEAERKNQALQIAAADSDIAALTKNRFLATMSHEIRTPMAGIRTAIALLQHPKANEAMKGKYLDILDDSSKTLLALVNNLLDTAKLDMGSLTLQPEPFNLHACLRTTVAPYALEAQKKGLALTWSVQDEESVTLVADLNRLQQMLSKLLDNAFKYTQNGSVHVRISSRAGHANKKWWTFSVTDTGTGLSLEDQSKLFNRFSQVHHNNENQTAGSGLSLMLVKRLAQAMGGEVGVDSHPGAGACFHFSIPLASTAPELQRA
ncbi:MAG: ATP-binding protein [Burkholderiales bacterium]|nr:ATP-binding protein [Burkholderiales bacterium]